jgi:hypothetical protein
MALAPYPRSTQQIRPEDYVATLTVDRLGANQYAK